MKIKPHQFICPDCGQVTDKGIQRKRCPKCAHEHHKAQMRQWHKDNFSIGRGA